MDTETKFTCAGCGFTTDTYPKLEAHGAQENLQRQLDILAQGAWDNYFYEQNGRN